MVVLEGIKGLSETEALIRLSEGYNEIQSGTKRGLLDTALNVMKEPMFILLLICSGIYFILGDTSESIMLLSFVLFIIGITLFQENKTERAIEALRDLSSPRALVIRDGANRRIPGREVVVDDILVLSEGDRVPADAVLLSVNNLQIDESLLTGESVPVRKANESKVYSGTLVVSGTGIAKVNATGQGTELGKIGKAIAGIKPERTLLQIETDRIVKGFSIAGLFLSLIVVVAFGLMRGDWLHGVLTGITLAMSILPEEFPVVLTVFLAIGAWRMSRRNVLARKQHAIQALGSVTVLCVDKTGTITENKMAVRMLYTPNGEKYMEGKLSENFHDILEFGILASKKEPFDPMEKALKNLCDEELNGTEHIHDDWDLVEEYPLTEKLLAVSNAWKSGRGLVVAAKGAPEAILDLCHLPKKEIERIMSEVTRIADSGMRVIGVAKGALQKKTLPKDQHEFKFRFLGLVGFEDPVKRGVKDAVMECYRAGIKVKMITGDYPGTARSIARQIGLANPDEVMLGSGLDESRIKEVNIFARVVPEQKLKIVETLKKSDEIVAMTGDGVNDAPALKAAHVGVSMGGKGTDVAREASSLVLIDDNFTSIVKGVKMGRRIFENIRKAMAYILSVHIPIAGITLISVFMDWPLILLPVHILFLEMIIDPACSIVFEAEPAEPNVMRKKPRDPKEKIFNREAILLASLQGVSVLIVMVILFLLGKNEGEGRALAFTMLIISNLLLILVNKSWSLPIYKSIAQKNPAFWIVSASAILFLGLSLYLPYLQAIFKFGTLHLGDILIALSAALFSVAWFEILKLSFKKFKIRDGILNG